MLKSKPIANIVLAIMTGLFLLCYPFRENWYMALLTHIFGAAMIGGLADWYAVTALFSKPLGISYKTALLPRARNRIINIARHMVTEELLTVPHIYKVVKGEQLIDKIVLYILSPKGRGQVHEIIGETSSHLVEHFDMNIIGQELNYSVNKGINQWRLTPVVITLLEHLLQPAPMEILWQRLNEVAQQFLKSEALRPYMITLVEQMLARYKEGSSLREMAFSMADSFLSPEQIVAAIQRHGVRYLESQRAVTSPLAQQALAQAQLWLKELKGNPVWQAKIEAQKLVWVEKLLLSKEGALADWQNKNRMVELLNKGEEWFISYNEELFIDKEKQKPLERFFLFQLVPALQMLRPIADKIVVRELEAYSAEKMTELLKDKVYYDLQMIRINGSLVGALLGGIFFIALSLVKGVL